MYDEDRLFLYRDGYWHPVDPDKEIAAVQAFAGSSVGTGKKTSLLRLSYYDCVGSIRLAHASLKVPDFFRRAKPGLAFRNRFLTNVGNELALVEHSQDHRARFAYPFDFDPNAQCPLWAGYLETVWEGDPDPVEKRLALQEFVGACLFGEATRYKTCLFLFGDTWTGKSTAIDVIQGLFTPGTTTSIGLHDLEQEYRRAKLSGKLLNTVAEVPSSDLMRSEAFKAIVAGDIIEGRHVRERPFDFKPLAGHIFAANTLPHVSDRSDAVWSRIIVLAFNRRFNPAGENGMSPARLGLATTILQGELPGLLVWAAEGYQRLLQLGHYTRPPSSAGLLAQWRFDSNPVEVWVDEELEFAARAWIKPHPLYSSYEAWAKMHGHRHIVTASNFYKQVEAVLKKKSGRSSVRRMLKGHNVFDGVRLRRESLLEDMSDGSENPAGIAMDDMIN